jgi:hypothetical protein
MLPDNVTGVAGKAAGTAASNTAITLKASLGRQINILYINLDGRTLPAV